MGPRTLCLLCLISIGLSLSQDATLWGNRTCVRGKDGAPKPRLHRQNPWEMDWNPFGQQNPLRHETG